MSASSRLPDRASLEFIRKQSKDLQRAFRDGEPEAVARVREHLPRAARLAGEEPAAIELSLQEAQHALAREYGFAKWEALMAAVQNGSAGFEDLARLSDIDAQRLMGAVKSRELALSLIGAPSEVQGRFLSNTSRRARTAFEREMRGSAGIEPARVEDLRSRIVAAVAELAARDRVEWPPKAEASPPLRPRAEGVYNPLRERSLETLSIDEIATALRSLAEAARKEGILALEWEAEDTPTLLGEALRLIVDGTEPSLIETLLTTRTERVLQERRTRLRLFIDGVTSMQRGENPWTIRRKLLVYFLDSDQEHEPSRHDEQIEAAELARWIAERQVARMEPIEIADLFLHMAFLARRLGLAQFEGVTGAVDDAFLAEALRLPLEGKTAEEVEAIMEQRLEEDAMQLKARLQAATKGVMAIQDAQKPADIEDLAREAAQQVLSAG